MVDRSPADAERRLTAVVSLQEYLMQRFPRIFDGETDEWFRTVLRAVSHNRAEISSELPDEIEVLSSDLLCRNHLIAQCSALLLFANRVSLAASANRLEELPAAIEAIWSELERLHVKFFGEPPESHFR